jgi:hypothetical protein
MVSMSPISVVFSMIQSLTMLQYFLKQKLNSLKDLTWGIIHKKSVTKNQERMGNIRLERKDTENQTTSKEEKTPEMKTPEMDLDSESFYETIEITHVEVDMELEMKIDHENEKKVQRPKSENTNKEEKLEDVKKLQKLFCRIKFAKFLISDFFKLIIVCFSYVVKKNTSINF